MHVFALGEILTHIETVIKGWYLSMKPEDSFFYKLGSEEGSNFKEFNSKTIGFILVIISFLSVSLYVRAYNGRHGVCQDT